MTSSRSLPDRWDCGPWRVSTAGDFVVAVDKGPGKGEGSVNVTALWSRCASAEAERDGLRPQVAELEAELEALKAEALDVCGITYGMLTAGIVDDHDRIMRACNELAEFGRRLTGDAEALRRREPRPASDDSLRRQSTDAE